eukprot:m.321001 g.321001  ORF g.321001 m.321001 type:complete len:279 (-) comp20327_c0_seq7:3112-3948(-)
MIFCSFDQPTKMWKVSTAAMCVTLVLLSLATEHCIGTPRITVVTQNLSWLENLVLVPSSDSMFVSELKFGRVWKIQMNSNRSYTRQLWVSSNFTRILGLTKNTAVPSMIYGVGSQGDENVVFSISTSRPNNFTIIAHTPKGRVGNGFGCHYASGKLYTASEGDFLPGTGSVYEIDPQTGKVTTISESLWAADGLWIDQDRHLLYVGQVTDSKMFIWNITSQNGAAVPKGSVETGITNVALSECIWKNCTAVVGLIQNFFVCVDIAIAQIWSIVLNFSR